MFCAPSRIDEPASACATAGIRMSGGAIITSRSLASAAASGSISVRILSTRARAPTGNRCIFQFPAISFLRMSNFERLDPWQFAAFQKFERGAASCRDMRELAGPRRVRERGRCVSATDYRDDAGLIGERLAYTHRAARKRWNFEEPERAVPYYGFGARDLRNKRIGGLRSDVEAHHLGRNFSNRMRRRAGFGSACDDVIGRQNNFDVLAGGLGEQFLRQLDFVVFDARLADRDTLSLEERVRHRAANQDRI